MAEGDEAEEGEAISTMVVEVTNTMLAKGIVDLEYLGERSTQAWKVVKKPIVYKPCRICLMSPSYVLFIRVLKFISGYSFKNRVVKYQVNFAYGSFAH